MKLRFPQRILVGGITVLGCLRSEGFAWCVTAKIQLSII